MESVLVVNVGGFIMTHGGVKPKIATIQSYLKQKPDYPPSHEYVLTAKPLPENTRLFAPSILGNVYYDHPDSEGFIHKLHEEYMKITEKPRYIDYFLQEINKFEQEYVVSSEKRLEQESRHTLRDIILRSLLSKAIVHKSRVEWKEHKSCIAEKTYFINPEDKPQNSIMFFCEENPPIDVSSPIFTTKGQFITEGEKHISYSVEHKVPMFIIHFENENEVENILLDDIRNLLLDVLHNIISVQHSIRLSIFDFTCSELIFPTDDDRLSGVKPVLLSSDKSSGHPPFLLYGTIRDVRFSEILRMGRMSPAHTGSLSPARRMLSVEEQSYLSGRRATPSPAHPTASLVVHLVGGVESFADFNESKYDSRARSISPPPSPPSPSSSSSPPAQHGSDRGGRRCVVKKVSQKRMIRRCRRCNSRTKVRTKRSNRRRRTKSKH